MKLIIASIFMLFLSFGAFSQLDSINVTYSMTEIQNPEDSTQNGENLEVRVWVNDFDFFGEVIVDVIHVESQYPLAMVKKTKLEIQNENLLDNQGWITLPVGILGTGSDLEIKVQVRNFQELNLPQVTIIHNN